jgi:hypothetical protein
MNHMDEITRTIICDIPDNWQAAMHLGSFEIPSQVVGIFPIHRPVPVPVDTTKVSAYRDAAGNIVGHQGVVTYIVKN